MKTGREQRMKEPYGEGPTTHTGPESCVVVREDGGEALTGVRAGRTWSREIPLEIGVPTPSHGLEGNTGGTALVRSIPTPRGQRPRACTETLYTGIGRSLGRPGHDGGRVRDENPMGASRR